MFRYAAAPWPLSLRVTSAVGTLLLLVVGGFAVDAIPRGSRDPVAVAFGWVIAAIPPLILLGALLFVVRGYELDRRELRVRRLLWNSRYPLRGLQGVWQDAGAIDRSLRLFGNGGLYAFTGLYQNAGLGRYRAFFTDPRRAVVLRLQGRTLVISPREPARFVEGARELFPQIRHERPDHAASPH